jgi:hypothetical protein
MRGKGRARVLKPNGEELTTANIGMVLATRDLMADLRARPIRSGRAVGRFTPRQTAAGFLTHWTGWPARRGADDPACGSFPTEPVAGRTDAGS